MLGDRLHCVFVDNGLLRYQEAERVMATFNQHLHLPVTKVDDAGECGGSAWHSLHRIIAELREGKRQEECAAVELPCPPLPSCSCPV